MNRWEPLFYEFIQNIFVRGKHLNLKKMIESSSLPVPARVLDVGCGTGQAAVLFCDKTQYDYVGVEVSDSCIIRARERFPELSFHLINMVETPLQEPLFDFILIDSVFHHLSDDYIARLLEQLTDLLHKDGILVIQDMVYPEKRGGRAFIQRLLIALDRGKYCRKREELVNVLKNRFAITQEVTHKISTYDFFLLKCKIAA